MQPKFRYFEVVRIKTSAPVPSRLMQAEGVVLGMANRYDGSWGYAVQISADGDRCWDLPEDALEPTGRHTTRSAIYPGDRVRVTVDPTSGRGQES